METRADAMRRARRAANSGHGFEEKGWYHSFALPGGATIDGVQTLEDQRRRYSRFPLPADLAGRRVLDIGAWDGWFSFEAERRGAEVTAVDCVEIPNFLEVREKLASRVDYRIVDVYELPQAGLGQFDYVFFLGVLYHLKHPLLALEIVCALAREIAVVDSFVIDANTWAEHAAEIPSMEFYETDELGGQLDNWFGPSVGCLMALCRAAGFARVELVSAAGDRACVACYRKWEPSPDDAAEPPPVLTSVFHTRNSGVNFYTRREEYVTCWFRSPRSSLSRDEVRIEIDGYGAPAIYVMKLDPPAWQANCRLPPGLSPGWKPVRIRTRSSDFSEPLRIAVDLSPETDGLVIRDACDGVSWRRNEAPAGGVLSFWVEGLAENCDRNNVRVCLGAARLTIDFISPPGDDGFRQVNAIVPAALIPGSYPLVVSFGRVSTEAVAVRVLPSSAPRLATP